MEACVASSRWSTRTEYPWNCQVLPCVMGMHTKALLPGQASLLWPQVASHGQLTSLSLHSLSLRHFAHLTFSEARIPFRESVWKHSRRTRIQHWLSLSFQSQIPLGIDVQSGMTSMGSAGQASCPLIFTSVLIFCQQS
jgi:hypothetical protein